MDPLPDEQHNLPVSSVHYCDVLLFANRLSEARGLRPAYLNANQCHDDIETVSLVPGVDGFRLPTATEWLWLYAQESTRCHGQCAGNELGRENAHLEWLAYTVWKLPNRIPAEYTNDYDPYTHRSPPGSFARDPNGIDDLVGNVSEYVWPPFLDLNQVPQFPSLGSAFSTRPGDSESVPRRVSSFASVDIGFRLVSGPIVPPPDIERLKIPLDAYMDDEGRFRDGVRLSLPWDNEDPWLSLELKLLLRDHLATFAQARDIVDYCPTFHTLTRVRQVDTIATIIMVASGHSAEQQSVTDAFQSLGARTDSGLDCRPNWDVNGNGTPILQCAIPKLASLVAQDGVIGRGASPRSAKGLARVWPSLLEGKRWGGSRASVIDLVKVSAACVLK